MTKRVSLRRDPPSLNMIHRLSADCRGIASNELGNNKMRNFKPARNQQTVFNILANRRRLPKLICLAVILMGFVLGGCDFNKVEAQTETNSKGESSMESIQTTTTIQNKIPPIDAAVSTETATATFAMG
jgi:hypothetical protein